MLSGKSWRSKVIITSLRNTECRREAAGAVCTRAGPDLRRLESSTRYLFLAEPLPFLDIRHQIDFMEKVKVFASQPDASGIGYSIAWGFAKEGSRVVIADLDRERSESAALEIAEKTGGLVRGIELDVTNEASVEAGIRAVVGELGSVDILVSKAGIQFISSLEPVINFFASS